MEEPVANEWEEMNAMHESPYIFIRRGAASIAPCKAFGVDGFIPCPLGLIDYSCISSRTRMSW